ncbi:MAG: MotA/TolQ/ExbB proton channel family protein [Deltaproteobacteria bacterium]|nr:MotA/TolQ/ExbB proton channel family protein [Deltaproteobacteria bacterium]MDD9826942.1 MotA/TolQ/ExbB proton channel family protein [Deltaproteobacteria bacterium]MDD9853563.1 MotA/TolQ/ExbB proton channel family protein [Deltaproteobacteria bacterium]MDD9873879.1 MotA/TolQ/ExbB proton channel family protein [Deltaproteobacteria bacterium]
MRNYLSSGFLYQVAALLLSVALAHTVFAAWIRPGAEAVLAERALLLAQPDAPAPGRSLLVTLKDYEQEACFILLLWAMAIMGQKARAAARGRRILQQNLVRVAEGMSVLPEDAREFARPIQALPAPLRALLPPRALLTALQRFAATRNVQDVSEAVRGVCEAEADRLDSELSMVRYIAWAIPSIGFIGTVRGIGAALGQAHEAVRGDIAGVTANLGVAFNSTFVALVLSILLMFLMHQLQLVQERLVLDTQGYADENLLRHMQVR